MAYSLFANSKNIGDFLTVQQLIVCWFGSEDENYTDDRTTLNSAGDGDGEAVLVAGKIEIGNKNPQFKPSIEDINLCLLDP
ncbi:hypothetical protein Lser_V15G29231 [Lactuca serriola]